MGTTSGDGSFNIDGTESTTITSTPNYGYVFNYWLEESTGNKIYSNPYTFTVTRHETYTAYFYAISINITTENSGAEILTQIADNTTTTYNFDIKFTTSNYLTQIKFTGDSVPRDIKNSNGAFSDVANCTSVTYNTNTDGSRLYLSVLAPFDSLTVTLYFTNVAQNYKTASGGTEITGVALQTRLSGTTDTLACVGKATITGYTTTDGLDEVIVYATASAGFAFSHWEVEGVALDTTTYGISARIPYETVNGKILVAVFTTNDANTNTDTETSDNGGFV